MARKTKTCNKVKLETKPSLLMRTCWRPRHHDGDCMDSRGSWKEDHG